MRSVSHSLNVLCITGSHHRGEGISQVDEAHYELKKEKKLFK